MLQPRTSPPRRQQSYDLKAGERTVIFGMTGFGKSQFAKFLDRAWFKQYDPREPERFWPILIYDPDEGWFKGTRFTGATTIRQKIGHSTQDARETKQNESMLPWRADQSGTSYSRPVDRLLPHGSMLLAA